MRTLVAGLTLALLALPAPSVQAQEGKFYALGSDPLRNTQWALDAHQFTSDLSHGTGVTVAVIDSGVDVNHPDLQGKVLPGLDLVAGEYQGVDPNGHGTHVAGVIAALTGNGEGIAAAAPGVSVLPVRVLDAAGEGWESDVAAGITWAVDNGADILNLSLGGNPDASVAAAVEYAQSSGVLVIAAAGNSGQLGNAPSYPAAYEPVLAVGAASSLTEVAAFSNTGPYVDIAAAGVSIASTYRNSSYVSMSGTSMAAPYVSAAAAVLLSTGAASTPAQAGQLLLQNTTEMYSPGRDDQSGYGLLNLAASLCSCQAPPPPVTPPETGPGLPQLPDLPDLPVLTPPTLPGITPPGAAPPGVPSPNPAQPTLPTLPYLPSLPTPGTDLEVTLQTPTTVTQGRENDLVVRVSRSGLPVRKAEVKVTGPTTHSGTTSASGKARIKLPSSANARYVISVTAPDRSSKLVSHTVWVEPNLKVKRKKRALAWSLTEPNAQLVSLYKKKGSSWRVVKTARTTSTSPTQSGRFKVKRKGKYMVKVSPSLGLLGFESKVFKYGK